jgi:hypothetical protein
MKSVIVIISVIAICLNSYSQNDTCIKEKWIAIPNDSVNLFLFHTRTLTNPIFDEIRNLVDQKKISLFCGNTECYEASTGKFINHKIFDNQFWSNGYDSLIGYNPYFEILVQSDIPLTNIDGSLKIVTDSFGNQMYQYPEPTIQQIRLDNLYELQLREVKVNGEFIPKSISFCMVDNGIIIELFSVDLDAVYSLSNKKEVKEWIQLIRNQKFQGFQFKQTECGNNFKRQ